MSSGLVKILLQTHSFLQIRPLEVSPWLNSMLGKSVPLLRFLACRQSFKCLKLFRTSLDNRELHLGYFLMVLRLRHLKFVKDILCLYGIKRIQSEPNHQYQSYAERRTQEVKSTSNI